MHKGCLASAMAGRQYPQLRVQQCGWATHSKFIFCLHGIVTADGEDGQGETKTARDPVLATPEQIEAAPEGSLVHRIYHCSKHKESRKKHANEADVQASLAIDIRGSPAWERALCPRPPLPLKGKAKHESFRWAVAPCSFPIIGTVYSDGSARDGPTPELIRCG